MVALKQDGFVIRPRLAKSVPYGSPSPTELRCLAPASARSDFGDVLAVVRFQLADDADAAHVGPGKGPVVRNLLNARAGCGNRGRQASPGRPAGR